MKVRLAGRLSIVSILFLGSAFSLFAASWVYGQRIVLATANLPDTSGVWWTACLVGLVGIVLSVLVAVLTSLLQEGTQEPAGLEGPRTAELLKAKENLEKENLERLEAEALLEEERNLLRTLMDILPSRIFVKNAQSEFVLANLAQAQIFGLDDSEKIRGKTTFDFIPDEGSERRLADDREVMVSGKSFINREEFAVNEDGSRRWSLTTKVPLKNNRGEIVGLVGTSTDITERKLAAEAVEAYAEELKRRNTQMEDDLQMAREIQLAFIPHQFPSLPHQAASVDSSLHFCHRYIPTTTLAGDFFEVLPISDDEVGIIICDVMGHGVRASLFTAYLRGLIEELRPVARDPGRLLTELNHGLMAILGRTGIPMFASAFYMVVDLKNSQLRFACAGHPAPFRLRRDNGQVEAIQQGPEEEGGALGLFEDLVYSTYRTDLCLNDLILFYTDGLFEVYNSDREQVDESQLLEALKERIDLSPDSLLDELIAEIRQFSVTGGFDDDVCLVAVEYCGSRSQRGCQSSGEGIKE